MQKNEQGQDPAPNHANQLIRYAYASILFIIHRDARGFAPACPPKTWTARDLDLMAELDRSRSHLSSEATLSDLWALVTAGIDVRDGALDTTA